jgi:putative restriction endonuclease
MNMSLEDRECKITRYLTKQDLVEANNAAIRERRNKTLSKDFVDSLPDDFICVVVWEYFHTKYEMRLGITVDLQGNWVLLDVSMTRFNSLPISKTYKNGRVELEPPEETAKRRPYADGRQWQEIHTKKPLRKQSNFRKTVLKAYGYQCAICGIETPELLRAAHIVPVVDSNDGTVKNGICLCANHEIAFDAGLLRIFPDGSAYIYDSSGQELERTTIKLPANTESLPSPVFLAKKLDLLCKKESCSGKYNTQK